jgi:NTE family protein
MRASMAVPGVFAPMEWDNHIYVDGGLVRNLPVDVARRMGVDAIIAVNLGSGYLPREKLGTILGVTGQMIAILTEQNVEVSLAELDPRRDVLVLPDLGDIGSADFARSREAIATGVAAARKAAPQLARFSVSEEEYAAWRRERFGPGNPVREVGEVRVLGLDRVSSTAWWRTSPIGPWSGPSSPRTSRRSMGGGISSASTTASSPRATAATC